MRCHGGFTENKHAQLSALLKHSLKPSAAAKAHKVGPTHSHRVLGCRRRGHSGIQARRAKVASRHEGQERGVRVAELVVPLQQQQTSLGLELPLI